MLERQHNQDAPVCVAMQASTVSDTLPNQEMQICRNAREYLFHMGSPVFAQSSMQVDVLRLCIVMENTFWPVFLQGDNDG